MFSCPLSILLLLLFFVFIFIFYFFIKYFIDRFRRIMSLIWVIKATAAARAALPIPISVCSIKYKVACMCFSAINGSGPVYLSELLHVYTPSRTVRSSSDTRMLEIQQHKRKTHGFRTFSCFGPHIWNSLPQDLRHCSTLLSFKAKLKMCLFSQYFHPN